MNAKRYHIRRVTIYMMFLFTVVMTSFIIPDQVSAEESCPQLLSNRCETCHYLTRVCQKVDKERNKKSFFGGAAGTWKRIIKNMVKQGAQLNAEEEKILVECLSSPTPEVLSLCNLSK